MNKVAFSRGLQIGSVCAILSTAMISAAAPAQISTAAKGEIAAILQEKATWTPVQKKLDSHLIHALKRNRGETFAPGAPQLELDLQPEAEGRVLVDIRANVTPALLDLIKRTGGTVVVSVPRFKAVRAQVRLEQLEAIAALGEVRSIRRADRADFCTGSVDSAGDTVHQAAAIRAALGIAGAGVKVGVLSDSVDYYTNSQTTGDLGPLTILAGQSGLGGGGTGEGTAMLEIIHDLAPGAQLYFATANNGTASFAQNILGLQSSGCNVLVDDVDYFSESPFQDDTVAQAVNTVTAAGVLYFSSAGNSGNLDSGTAGTWEGDFVDGGPAAAPISESGRLHSFGLATYDTVVPGGSNLRCDLFWSDPLGGSANDYDLFVLDSTGSTVLRSSTNPQTGSEDPYESVSTLNPGEQVVIVLFSGVGRFLHLSAGRGVLTIATRGAAHGHNCATNAFGVAAVDALTSYPNAFTGGTTNPVETFSSDGPRRVFFDAAGNALTSGNFSSTGGVIRQKPDLAASDDVETSVPGFQPFSGTSAAAPHAAAIAALLKSYNPALGPAQFRAVLTSSTLDIMAPGVDPDAGSGLVMATALLAAPPDALLITPGNGLATSGASGGPFTFSSSIFTLTNTGTSAFNWSGSPVPAWADASQSGGVLTPGGAAASVTMTLNSSASNLPPGLYVTNLWFTNLTTGTAQTRSLNLSIAPTPVLGAYGRALSALAPLVYWRLNETNQPPGPDVVTNSGSLGTAANGFAYDGVVQGEPGIVGACFRFSNPSLAIAYLGSHVDIPYSSALNSGGPFTVELWTKPAQITHDLFAPAAALDLSQNGGASRNGWVMYQNGSSWQFRVGGSNGYAATLSGGTAQPGSWQHLVGVYDGSSAASLYVNGALVAGPTAAAGFNPNTVEPLRIGATTIPNRTFDGWVDEVAFYDSALAPNTIAAHYAAASTNNAGYPAQVLADNPLGYWRLEGPPATAPGSLSMPLMVNSGSLAPNADGRYQIGSVPGVPGVPFWAFGPGNVGCQLPGSSFTDCPGTFLNLTGPLTLLAWVNIGAANGANQSILSKGIGSYYLLLDGSGLPHFADGAQPNGDLIGPASIADGQWHQLAAVYDGAASQFLYVDGQLAASAANATAPVAGNSLEVWLGDAPDDAGFESLNGIVDEVAIFSAALASAQIQQLYLIATNIPPAPLITAIQRSGSAAVTLTSTAVPGYTYQAQYASALPSAWTTLTTVSATASTLTITDNPASFVPRFYRVLIPFK